MVSEVPRKSSEHSSPPPSQRRLICPLVPGLFLIKTFSFIKALFISAIEKIPINLKQTHPQSFGPKDFESQILFQQ